MGSNHQDPPDCIDEKDVSGLSTVLVATIQEVKDRMSQIEYIFCRQLFPDFLSKSRSLEAVRKEREQEREPLLRLVDKLKLEMQQAVRDGQFLRKELFQLAKEKEESVRELSAKLSSVQIQVNDLQRDLKRKTEEIDEGIRYQEELIELVSAASSKDLGRGLSIHEGEKPLLAKHKCLEAAVTGLLEDLRRKDAELAHRVYPLMEDLSGPEGPYKEKRRIDSEKRDGLISLRSRVDVCAEEKARPEETKKAEVEERQQPSFGAQCSGEGMNEDQQKYCRELVLRSERKRIDAVNAYKQLKSQYNFLCKKVGLSPGDPVVPKKTLQEDSSSGHEQKDVTTTAQKGSDLSTTGVPCGIKVKEETVHEDYISLEDGQEYAGVDNSSSGLHGFSKIVKSKFQDGVKEEHLTNDGGDREIEDTSPPSPDSTQEFPAARVNGGESSITTGGKHTLSSWRGTGNLNGGEPNTTTGKKRTASSWRETRSDQNMRGPDPHDDFLDTPFENIRENLKKAGKYGGGSSTVRESRERDIGSDDGSKDLIANSSHQKQQKPVSSPGDRSFKFVAPARRKDERENLKGVECRQCKKFFDSLSDGEREDGRMLHCEHHDGVSRHRYRYLPPMTPEGFWSIGFESET